MANQTLNVIIDERKQLDSVDTQALMGMLNQHVKSGQSHVFKDYLLSSEVFYVDSDLTA